MKWRFVMETNVRMSIGTLNKAEIEAEQDCCSRIDLLRDKLTTIFRGSWKEVKEQSLLTESVLRRLEGYYCCTYEIKEIRGKGTIGMVVGDYFEDLVADTLRRYLKSVFKNAWRSGMLGFFRNKRIRNVTPDIVVEVRGVPLIAIEVKVNFGRRELDNVKANHRSLSEEGIDYFVLAASFQTDLFGIWVCEEEELAGWVCVLADWREEQSAQARAIKTVKFTRTSMHPLESLFEDVQKVISHAVKSSWLRFIPK